MHKLFLCLRYLSKKRIAFFGTAAVALCVALLIVITSIFNGFISQFHNYWYQANGQIELYPQKPMYPYEALMERIEEIDGIANARAIIFTSSLLYLAPGDVRGVAIMGLDSNRYNQDENFCKGLLFQGDKDQTPDFSLSLDTQNKFKTWYEKKFRRPPTDADMPVGVIVGIGMLAQPDELTDEYDRQAIAEKLLQRKSPMFIISGKQGEMSVKKIKKLCWPVNVLESGNHQADTDLIYLPFDYARDLIGIEGANGKKECLATIQIYLKPDFDKPVNIALIKQQIQKTWTDFAINKMNWSQDEAGAAKITESMQSSQLLLVTREIRKQLAIMQKIRILISV